MSKIIYVIWNPDPDTLCRTWDEPIKGAEPMELAAFEAERDKQYADGWQPASAANAPIEPTDAAKINDIEARVVAIQTDLAALKAK